MVTADDLVNRKFRRRSPDEHWVTDLFESRMNEGKAFCCCVTDALIRKIMGWLIDTIQNSNLVVNALDMALKNHWLAPGGVVHADHGVHFTCWAVTNEIRESGLTPSLGLIGERLGHATTESFCSAMQFALLDRQRWPTRVELAIVMFECIDVFHNRKRRHAAPGYRIQTKAQVAHE